MTRPSAFLINVFLTRYVTYCARRRRFREMQGAARLLAVLCASIADCFVLTFRAIARASKLEWSELACRVEGVLERVDGVAQYTRFTTSASLKVTSDSDAVKVQRLLEKAEHLCLVSNSLRGQRNLITEIVTTD